MTMAMAQPGDNCSIAINSLRGLELGLKGRWEARGHMNGLGLRFVISLVSIAAALIAFMAIGNSWAATGVIVGIFILSAIIERDRLTDAETKRRGLEDRVRNPPL
jgi:hypothetical protein